MSAEEWPDVFRIVCDRGHAEVTVYTRPVDLDAKTMKRAPRAPRQEFTLDTPEDVRAFDRHGHTELACPTCLLDVRLATDDLDRVIAHLCTARVLSIDLSTLGRNVRSGR